MIILIDIIKYIILGIIQGISEIFPVSSSGHLTIFANILSVDTSNLTIFLMITNAGSFLALLFFFRKDILSLIVSSWNFVFRRKKLSEDQYLSEKKEFHYVLKLLIAAVPIGIAGLLIKDYLPDNLFFVGTALLVTGVLLSIVFYFRNQKFANEVTWKNAMVIGLFQTLAVFPGISRSGITIVGGLSQKVNLKDALRFSFLCYIIISVPVTLLGVYDALNASESIHIVGYSLAFVFSFIATLVSVKFIYKYVQVKNLIYFAIYCLIIGSVAIGLHFFI